MASVLNMGYSSPSPSPESGNSPDRQESPEKPDYKDRIDLGKRRIRQPTLVTELFKNFRESKPPGGNQEEAFKETMITIEQDSDDEDLQEGSHMNTQMQDNESIACSQDSFNKAAANVARTCNHSNNINRNRFGKIQNCERECR